MTSAQTNTAPVAPLRPLQATVDLSPYEVPHPRPFICSITVTDDLLSRAIPHVSNIEYVRWLDRAAELHSDHVGYTRERMLRENFMWFVARHEIDYHAEGWGDDRLLVATWARTFKRVKSWRDSVIVRPHDGTIVCRAATLWVLVDLTTRRPKRITADLAAAFDPLDATDEKRGRGSSHARRHDYG